jgi:putative transposase
LKDAIAAVLDGAQWQRCRTHFTANLLNRIPRHGQPMVGTLVWHYLRPQRPGDAWDQLRRVVDQLAEIYPDAAAILEDAASDILAYTAYPKDTWTGVEQNVAVQEADSGS